MTVILADRVRETTAVVGTGPATLLGAVVGYQSFSVVGNANLCYYTIADQAGANWEVGIGTYATSGSTLTRTTILASSNSGSVVNFTTGTKDVFLTQPAEKAVTTQSLYTPDTFAGTFVAGVAIDYVSPNGRISVGTAGTLTFYTGGVGSTAMASMTSTGINSTAIGATTASTGAFTTLSASSTVSGTGFSTYLAAPPPIGSTTANTGAFTTLGATGAITANTTTNNQSYTTTGAGTITITSGTAGNINNMNIGATTAGTGAFTTLSASSTVSGTGFSNWLTSQLTTPPPIGGTTPSTGAFTSLTSTLDTIATDGLWAKGALNATFTDGTVVDYVTGNGRISVGTNDNLTFYTGGVATTQVFQVKYTGQINIKPLAAAPTGAAGDIYYNSVSNQFQGYNGTAWLPVGGASISNDTTTATPLYPVFANATSGTATTVYTSNANYLYTPSTGELSAVAQVSSNGIFVNANTINANYTIVSTNNGGSFGPVSVASGVTVTVSSSSVWTVV